MSADLELRRSFFVDMCMIYHRGKKYGGCRLNRFFEMVSMYGGVDAARRLIGSNEVGSGFTDLLMNGCVGMTVEALCCCPRYASLFSSDERNAAAERLYQSNATDPFTLWDESMKKYPPFALSPKDTKALEARCAFLKEGNKL